MRAVRTSGLGQRYFSTGGMGVAGRAGMGLYDQLLPKFGVRDYEKMVEDEKRGIFRVLDIGKPRPIRGAGPNDKKGGVGRVVVKAGPREKTMKPDQDWPSVWPATRTFHPASVPLPVRQGFSQLRGQPTPSKHANVELMKVPNFLHLTPPAIQRHCDVIKAKFCTEVPEILKENDELEWNFPLTEVTTDYLNSSSSIRDHRSRIVTVRFKLGCLGLDRHSRDKFLRLVEERYDEETDEVTITSDRMPYRKQNREYCEYLIKVLYHEANRKEEWEESGYLEPDASEYRVTEQEMAETGSTEEGKAYLKSITKVLNEGDSPENVQEYKDSVAKMLGLKDELPVMPDDVKS